MSRPADLASVVDHAIRDLRYGLRVLGRSPMFTVVAILSLALGIGANAAIFELIDTVRLRSLPIVNPQELAEVRANGVHAFGISAGFNSEVTYPLWEQIRTHQDAFASMFAWADTTFLVGRGGDARHARGLWVSGAFFRVLGIAPEQGRLLTDDDDRRGCGAGAAVVNHAFWQTHLGGQRSAIGSTLVLLDQPFTIVGVTPAAFTGLEVGQTFDVAVPVCSAAVWEDTLDWRNYWWLRVMGRLKQDWTIARADQHIRALSSGFLDVTLPPGYSADLTNQYRSLRFGVIPAGRGVSRLRESHMTSLSLLLGLTGLVLLITCGNLATLMLARASGREREIAVRAAIGASRPRLISQMLIESLLIAGGGAALAVPAAVITAKGLVAALETPANPIVLNLAADWRLIAFVAAISLVTAMAFGLVPALRVSIVDPIAAMRHASRGLTIDRHRARLQRALVVGQIAVSMVLVVSAFAFVQSFRRLTSVDIGFEPQGALAVAFLDLKSTTLPIEQRIAFQQRLVDEIRSVPGVTAAASSTRLPFSGGSWAHFFKVIGAAGDERRVSRFTYVSPGYFDVLKIPIRSGRDFRDFDHARSRRVMLVNESFVRSHLGGLNPIGSTLRTIAEAGYPETTYEIIGVVGNTKYSDLRPEDCWCATPAGGSPPVAYVPIAQDPDLRPWASVIVRTGISQSATTSAIAQRVQRMSPAISVEFIELTSEIRERLVADRMIAWLAGGFGALAMVLVTVGLYGIIAYLAVSRRNEIGIRLSLGAAPAQIVVLVLRDSLWLLATGLAIGLPLTIVTLRAVGTLLFGLSPTDAPTLAGATALLAVSAIAAAGIPAWRASTIPPNVALRCE